MVMLLEPSTVPLTKIVPPFAPGTTLSFTYVPLFEMSRLPSIHTVPLIESCLVALFHPRCPTGVVLVGSMTVQSKLAPLIRLVVLDFELFGDPSVSKTNDPPAWHVGVLHFPR